MPDIRNNIPFAAIIFEPTAALFISIIAILSHRKYKIKQSPSTRFLSWTLTTLSLSIWATGIGKILMYYAPFTPEELNITGFTILIGYTLSAASNIFAAKFIQIIFKEEGSNFAFFSAIVNGITIGFILSKLIDPEVAFETNAYNRILPVLVWHIVITAITFSSLIIVSHKESKQSEQRLARIGFRLISNYGIAYLMIFAFFIADLIYGTSRGSGYTIFYYLGWTSAVVSTVFAYLGYIMPTWFRKKIEGD